MKNKCGFKIIVQEAAPLSACPNAANTTIKQNEAETVKPIDFDFLQFENNHRRRRTKNGVKIK
jgi:hypothetical protein